MRKGTILYIHPLGEHPNNNDNFYLNKSLNRIIIKKPQKYYSFIPMGIIGAINNLIKNRFKVAGIDLPLKKTLYNFDFESFLKSKANYSIFLIDIHWYVHLKNGVETAKAIKKHLPNSRIIIGGMTATIFYKDLIKMPFIDFIIKGDCEQPLLRLLKNIDVSKKLIDIPNLVTKQVDNPIAYASFDIDKYDYTDISWMEDYRQYIDMCNFWLLTAKGCPFNCKICDGNREHYQTMYIINKMIIRSPDVITTDIANLEHKTEFVNLSHDIALLGEDVIDKILKKKYNVGLYNEFFQLPSKELLQKLSNSFLSLELVFTLISGSNRERREFGKSFTNREFLKLLRYIKTLNFNGGIIIYFTDYMISQLEIKKLNAKKTAKLIKKIKKIYPYAQIEIMPQLVDPLCVMKEHNVSSDVLFKTYF